MNYLRLFLGFLYAAIIALLLLNNCKGCERDASRRTPPPSERPDPAPSPAPDDTTATPADSGATVTDEEAVDRAEDVGASGKLKVTLLWNFPGDIDLHVVQPNGVDIFFANPMDASTGGRLDVDDREGKALRGGGSASGGGAENIYWSNPPHGSYKIILEYYGKARVSGVAGSGPCKVVVFKEGEEPKTYEVHLGMIKEKVHVATISL